MMAIAGQKVKKALPLRSDTTDEEVVSAFLDKTEESEEFKSEVKDYTSGVIRKCQENL